MSRVRRFNSKVLGFSIPDSMLGTLTNKNIKEGEWGEGEEVNDWDLTPLDSQEQEELIEKFEKNNYLINKSIVDVMTVLYLFLAGLFLVLATKTDRSISCLLLGSIQSIICSCITLRYNLMNDFILKSQFKLRVNNSTINTINCVLIVFFEWIIINHLEDQFKWQFFLQIPLVLFIVTLVIRKWNGEMEKELSELRHLKYKYKNA